MIAVRDGDMDMIDDTLEQILSSAEFFQDSGQRYYYFRTVGHLELRLGNPEAARSALDAAIAIEQKEPLAHLLLAETLMALGSVEDAEAEATLGVELSNPRDKQANQLHSQLLLSGEVVAGALLPPRD